MNKWLVLQFINSNSDAFVEKGRIENKKKSLHLLFIVFVSTVFLLFLVMCVQKLIIKMEFCSNLKIV